MSTPNRTHLTEIIDEYERIFNDDLRVTLGLKLIQRGSLEFMQADSIPNVVPAIFVDIDPSIRIEKVQLPDQLMLTYNFRFIYVKKINIGENALKQKEVDLKVITEKLFDKYRLEDLSLTNGQILWSIPTEINFKPPEDVYVGSISSDLIAISFNVETVVRTRR